MFPLRTDTLPEDAEDLQAALEDSLRRVIQPTRDMVAVEDKAYPQLAAIRISLDDARAGYRPPAGIPAAAGAVEPALQVDVLELTGRPFFIADAPVDLSCRARDVRIGQSAGKDGKRLLILQSAAEGNVEVAIAIADLEKLVLQAAKIEAAKQGVAVEEVRLDLRSPGDRALELAVHVRARKLFLSATVRMSGKAAVDEHLTARLSDLECSGEGALGSLACGVLGPYLERFNGREFSLLALPLGEIKLHDVRVATGNELRVSARFGGS